MREILFRAQTRRLGEKVYMNGEKVPSNWVYGGICQGKGDFSIIYGSMDVELEKPTEKYTVYSDTVGQYTGLTDKNGTKIFEGDILKGTSGLHRVYFDTSLSCFEWIKINGNWTESFSGFADEYEIIGNIYDNPELLEVPV